MMSLISIIMLVLAFNNFRYHLATLVSAVPNSASNYASHANRERIIVGQVDHTAVQYSSVVTLTKHVSTTIGGRIRVAFITD